MTNFDHLDALCSRLGREKARLNSAKTANEIAFRLREIEVCEKEIKGEYKFLGIVPLTADEILMSDVELLNELMA